MVDESRPSNPNKQVRRVTIGDVIGGVRNSIIAAGNVIITIDISSALQALWKVLGSRTRQHWPALLTFTIIEIVILGGYLALKDRFLIPLWQFGLSTALLFAAVGFWTAWPRLGRRYISIKVVCIVSTVALIAVLSGVTWRIASPREFPEDVFGVVVTRFGYGPELRSTLRGKQITRDLIEKLEAEAQRQVPFANVRVREAGIVGSSDQAEGLGKRIKADLVIWGRIIVGEEGAITVHFEVLETPASALNPTFPRVLPIGYDYSAEAIGEPIDFRGTHYFGLKEAITGQSNAITCFVLGLALYLEHDFQEALRSFERAKEILETGESTSVGQSAADPGLVHYYLGKSYQMLGRAEKALTELEEAARLNERDPAVRLGLAYGYRSLERTEEAQAAAQKAVALCEDILLSDPDNAETQYDLGLAYQMLAEYEKALDAYLRVVKIDSDFYIAYISAGRIYALQEDFTPAIEMYRQATELAEREGWNAASAHLDLADVYLKQGNVELARDEYLTAVELAPEQDWIHFRLGQFYEAQGETDAAWQEYEQLVAVSANKAWAYAVLGDFFLGQQLYERAIDSYKEAIHCNPEDVMLSARLGEIYLGKLCSSEGKEGDAEKAERVFNDVLSKLPKDSLTRSIVLGYRAHLYFHLRRFDQAITDFTSVLEINPSLPEIWFSLARAYDEVKDTQNACTAYEKFLDSGVNAAEELVTYARERLRVLCNR